MRPGSRDSFGNVTRSTGSLANPFQYTGRDFDAETGLSYYRARYYDPQTGRFLSEDSAQSIAGVNFYLYVRGNSIAYRDPFGLSPSSIVTSFLWGAAKGAGGVQSLLGLLQ